MEAEVTFNYLKDVRDRRAFELVNKTNQFNLNGRRYTESSWQHYLERANVFMLTVNYKDCFGSLGKIAALTGHTEGPLVCIDTWVMSCRAFARRIEHQCLRQLFEKLIVDEIQFDFAKTPKNGPLENFFEGLRGSTPEGAFTVRQEAFQSTCPKLYHRVVEEGAPCLIPGPG